MEFKTENPDVFEDVEIINCDSSDEEYAIMKEEYEIAIQEHWDSKYAEDMMMDDAKDNWKYGGE